MDSKVYVGNLPDDVRPNDIEDVFYKYGRLRNVDLKDGGGRGPPFAFLDFEDIRDAEDAVKYRDGYSFDGCTLRVEFARGGRGRGAPGGFRGGGGFRGRGGFGGDRGGRYGPPSRRSDYRVRVTGLPPSGSWQDLKDHMREAGDVCYADVHRDGSGVVEYLKYDDMKYAIRRLDDTKFKSHEGETAYIRVKEEGGRGSRSRSRSPVSRGGGGGGGGAYRRSPSYSPKRASRSPSPRNRSRSRSPY